MRTVCTAAGSLLRQCARLRMGPARLLVAGVVLLGGSGAVAVASYEPPVRLSVSAGQHGATAPSDTRAADAATAVLGPPTTTPSTAPGPLPTHRPAVPRTTRATVAPTTGPTGAPTTTTTFDWRAAGLPGPVGSTVEPWTKRPYTGSAQGAYSRIDFHATADGAYPGTTMPLTIDATWLGTRSSGTLVLVGPMNYQRPADQQPTRVLDSWSTTCDGVWGKPPVQRRVAIDLSMQPVVTPDYIANDTHYALWTTSTTCDGDSVTMDSYLALTFFVNDPWIVLAPGPGFGHTG